MTPTRIYKLTPKKLNHVAESGKTVLATRLIEAGSQAQVHHFISGELYELDVPSAIEVAKLMQKGSKIEEAPAIGEKKQDDTPPPLLTPKPEPCPHCGAPLTETADHQLTGGYEPCEKCGNTILSVKAAPEDSKPEAANAAAAPLPEPEPPTVPRRRKHQG